MLTQATVVRMLLVWPAWLPLVPTVSFTPHSRAFAKAADGGVGGLPPKTMES